MPYEITEEEAVRLEEIHKKYKIKLMQEVETGAFEAADCHCTPIRQDRVPLRFEPPKLGE